MRQIPRPVLRLCRRPADERLPDAAAKEAERILVHGNANGLQLHTNVDGHCLDEPRFLPIFEIAAKADKPILLHPARTAAFADFAAEQRSRYEIWTIFGWPYETSATMARLIFSGIMTRFPDLKVLAHHLGAMIPFFDLRIETGWATLGSRTSDEDYSGVLKGLGKPLLDCFKDFYGDTALCGGRIGLDMRPRVLRPRSRAVRLGRAVRSGGRAAPTSATAWTRSRSLDVAAADKEKICYRNAKTLFGLPRTDS